MEEEILVKREVVVEEEEGVVEDAELSVAVPVGGNDAA